MQNYLKIIKLKYYFFTLVLLFFHQSCSINDAKPSKNQFLTIYSDLNLKSDSSLLNIFGKKEGINVRIVKIHCDSIFQRLKNEKFNSKADLILLSNYELIKVIQKNKMFFPIQSEILENNIDKNYRSKKNTWFALSKSPIVIAYNNTVLNKDTIKNYHELIHNKWNGKLNFQDKNNHTYLNFTNTIRFLLKEKADAFLIKFNQQALNSFIGSDKEQLRKINTKIGYLSLVKLSSLLESNQELKLKGEKSYLNFVYPNQRKKGCYISISGGGIYRYARNPSNAKKLLEFLSSKKAQKIYAQNRFEFPVTKGEQNNKDYQNFSRLRGRFFAY
jgi:iron(III) transport system substrate-binding protein